MGNLIDQFIQAAQTPARVVGNVADGVVNNLVQTANKNPIVKSIEQGPIGLAAQGKFNQIIPNIEQTASNLASGKVKPQMMFGGEMETVPGAGMDPITELPKTNPAAGVPPPPTQKTYADGEPPKTQPTQSNFSPKDYTGKNTWSQFVRDDNTGEIVANPDYKPGGTSPTSYAQTPPEYPKQEVNPNLQQTQPNPEPATANKPVVDKQPDLTPQQQKAFDKNGLSNYRLPQKYGDNRGPLEAQDKSVMANVVGGNSPEEVLQRLPQAEQNVWSQVTQKANQIPAVDIEKDVLPHINANLEDLVHKGIITDQQYEEISKTAAAQLYAKSTDLLSQNKTLTGKQLIDLQTGANARAPKSIPNGTTSPIPYINQAMSQGYRDAIGNASPDIRYSYNQYSSLKRIGEMSDNFRTTGGAEPGFFDQLKKNPLATVVGASVGLPALANGVKEIAPAMGFVGGVASNLFNKGMNDLGYYKGGQQPQSGNGSNPENQSNNYAKNSSSIHTYSQLPQSQDKVNIGEQLPDPSQITGPDGKPLGIPAQQFKDQKAQIDGQVANYQQLGIPVPQALLKQQAYLNESDPSNPNSLRNTYTTDSTTYGAAANAANMLNSVSPSFFNQFKDYNSFLKNTDPKYSKLQSAFSVLHAYNPAGTESIFSAGNKETAQAQLEEAMQGIGWHYLQKVNSYTGYTGQAASNLPPVATPAPNTFGQTQSNPQGLSGNSGGNNMQGSGFSPSFFQEQ